MFQLCFRCVLKFVDIPSIKSLKCWPIRWGSKHKSHLERFDCSSRSTRYFCSCSNTQLIIRVNFDKPVFFLLLFLLRDVSLTKTQWTLQVHSPEFFGFCGFHLSGDFQQFQLLAGRTALLDQANAGSRVAWQWIAIQSMHLAGTKRYPGSQRSDLRTATALGDSMAPKNLESGLSANDDWGRRSL
jgi:hypothetical protein